MRTIGRHWPKSARGDYAALCDYCSVRYRRSQLVKLPNGYFACSGPGTNDDAKGRDERTLDELNALEIETRWHPTPHRGGNFDFMPPPPPEPEPPPPPPAPTPIDVFGTNLREYWIASERVTVGTNYSEMDGSYNVLSWTGGLRGIVLAPTAALDFDEFSILETATATARLLSYSSAFNYRPVVKFPSMRSMMNDRALHQVLLTQGERIFVGAVLRDTNHTNGDHAFVTGYSYAARGNEALFWLVRQVGDNYRDGATIRDMGIYGSVEALGEVLPIDETSDAARRYMFYVTTDAGPTLKIDDHAYSDPLYANIHNGVARDVDLIEVGNGSSGGLEVALLVIAANVSNFQLRAFEVFTAQYFPVTP